MLTSVFSLMMCVAMLIGSTFAWFTDTASTNVNKIQSGKLDVTLEMKDAEGNWVNAEGETLAWKTADNRSTAVLWEPGCTYELPAVRVKNNGNLALKFNIVISGITGDAELLKAIDFTYGALDVNAEGHLLPGETSDEIVITGHMKEEAGNDYMDKSIEGIAITVVATQAVHEFDSSRNDYDEGLVYPVLPAVINKTISEKVDSENETVLESADVTAIIPVNALPEDVTDVTLRVETEETNSDSVTYEISLVDQNGDPVESTELITVKIKIGEGLKNVRVNHNKQPMNPDEYSYDSATGVVTIKTSSFSPFTIMFEQAYPGNPWTGSVDTEGLVQNTNTKEKTINIATAEQFAAFAQSVNSGKDYKGYTIELTNDLNLAGSEWTPIGTGANYFRGTFDGKNHTISGLTITGNNDKVALIGNFNGTIKDLTLTNVNISGRDRVAVVAANSIHTDKGGIISNVDVKKAVLTGGHYVGTIFGYGYGWSTISDCDVEDVTITVTPYLVGDKYDNGDKVGGLVGFTGDDGSNKIINNTVTKATITAYRDIGGLVGYSYTDTISGNEVTDVKIIVSKVNDYGKTELRAGEITGNRDLPDNTVTNVTIERP